MSDSKLVDCTIYSPNKTSPRSHKIDTITIHCMAGNISVEQCGLLFANANRRASSNYGIGTDGRIGLYVKEEDRSWASSNKDNDNRAVTIEVANDGGAETGWHVSDRAYNSLIRLLVDICKRNDIKALLWKADKNLIGQVDKQNMTVHRWFKAKACPGDYLYNLHGKIASDVNAQLGNKMITNIQNEQKSYEDVEKKVWNRFKNAGFSDMATAAIMGNLKAESNLRSNNLQNSYEKRLGMDDETYTAAINSGAYSKSAFVNDKAGYGLAQWTFWSRKEAFYKYMIEQNRVNIDDFDKQLDYIVHELETTYKGLITPLNNSKTLKEASDVIMKNYEKPADQGEAESNRRASNAQVYYNKFASNGVSIPFLVKVNRNDLNIRKGPGITYPTTGQVTGIGKFTIVDMTIGEGSSSGWGLLKSFQNNRDGWISLDFVERV